jgi:hypothetical protein
MANLEENVFNLNVQRLSLLIVGLTTLFLLLESSHNGGQFITGKTSQSGLYGKEKAMQGGHV